MISIMKSLHQRYGKVSILATISRGKKTCISVPRQTRQCSSSSSPAEKKSEVAWPTVVAALIITSSSVFATYRVPETLSESDKEELQEEGWFYFWGMKLSASFFGVAFWSGWYMFLFTRFGAATTWSATLKRAFLDQWIFNILVFAGVMAWELKVFTALTKEEWFEVWQQTFGDKEKASVYLLNQFTRAVATVMNFHFVPIPYRILIGTTIYAHETALTSALTGRDLLLAQQNIKSMKDEESI